MQDKIIDFIAENFLFILCGIAVVFFGICKYTNKSK